MLSYTLIKILYLWTFFSEKNNGSHSNFVPKSEFRLIMGCNVKFNIYLCAICESYAHISYGLGLQLNTVNFGRDLELFVFSNNVFVMKKALLLKVLTWTRSISAEHVVIQFVQYLGSWYRLSPKSAGFSVYPVLVVSSRGWILVKKSWAISDWIFNSINISEYSELIFLSQAFVLDQYLRCYSAEFVQMDGILLPRKATAKVTLVALVSHVALVVGFLTDPNFLVQESRRGRSILESLRYFPNCLCL